MKLSLVGGHSQFAEASIVPVEIKAESAKSTTRSSEVGILVKNTIGHS